MEFIFFWIALVVAVGYWASKWNRSALGWGLFSFVLSPLLAGIFLAIAGPSCKVCPDCANRVPKEARICAHCRYEFPQLTARPPPTRLI